MVPCLSSVLGTSIFLQIVHAWPTINSSSSEPSSSNRWQLSRNFYDGTNSSRRVYNFSSAAKHNMESSHQQINIENLLLSSNKTNLNLESSHQQNHLQNLQLPSNRSLGVVADITMIRVVVHHQPPYTNARNTSHIKSLQNPMNLLSPKTTKSPTPSQNLEQIPNWLHTNMTKNSSSLDIILTQKYTHRGFKTSAYKKSPHKNIDCHLAQNCGGISFGLSSLKNGRHGNSHGRNLVANKIDVITRKKTRRI